MSKTPANKRHVAILLDETGSMSGQQQRVVTGINEYISKLQADMKKKACTVALSLFNSDSWRTFYEGPLQSFPKMQEKDYQPGSMTPLYDAMSKIISQAMRMDAHGKTLVIVDTDGMENASREVSKEALNAQVIDAENKGFTFVFFGAEMAQFGGALQATQSMGIKVPVSNVMGATNAKRGEAYGVMASATVSYLSDPKQGSISNFFDNQSAVKGVQIGDDTVPEFSDRVKSAGHTKKSFAASQGVWPETVTRWGDTPAKSADSYLNEVERNARTQSKLDEFTEK